MSWTTRLRGIYTGHAAEVTSQLVLRGGDRLGASPGCAARPVPKLAERPCESDTAAVPGILAWTHADPGEVVEVFVGLSGGDGSIGDVEALEDVVLDDNLGKVLLEEVVDVEAEICNVFGFEAADDVRASTARRAEVKNCGKPLTNATQHLQAFGERSFPVDSRHWRRPAERQFQAHEIFRDRTQAGQLLAEQLMQYADRDDVLVLALPRGGVPVAFEVARRLRAPLDIFVVRKLGVPVTRNSPSAQSPRVAFVSWTKVLLTGSESFQR